MSFLHWLKYLPTPKTGLCDECHLEDGVINEGRGGGFNYLCSDCKVIVKARIVERRAVLTQEKKEKLRLAKITLRKYK